MSGAMTDRLKKLGFPSRTRNPQSNSPVIPTGVVPPQGRPPSYSGYGAQPPPQQQLQPQPGMRPVSAQPPPQGVAPYPHGPTSIPLGHPGVPQQMMQQGIPQAMQNPQQQMHPQPPYYQQPPRDMGPPPAPPSAAPRGAAAEVEGGAKSKAQLIVGIDFVSRLQGVYPKIDIDNQIREQPSAVLPLLSQQIKKRKKISSPNGPEQET